MSNIPINERRLWVGASEVAALLGASPHLTRFELWHIKKGNIPAPNLDDNERVQAGQFLESAIAAWASHKWSWPLRNVSEYLQHPRVPRMGASLDFATIEGEPVEIKTVDYLVFRDDWEADRDVIVDAPAHYLIQVQAQLACSGRDRGWLVPCVGGNRLYRMEIPRHDRLIARIEREVEDFWESIEANREPQPDFETDAATIAHLYGGKGDEVADLRGNERARELCDEYLAAHEAEKGAATRKKAALAEIKTLMNDARGALIDGDYSVKASFVQGGTYTRADSWRFNINRKGKGDHK